MDFSSWWAPQGGVSQHGCLADPSTVPGWSSEPARAHWCPILWYSHVTLPDNLLSMLTVPAAAWEIQWPWVSPRFQCAVSWLFLERNQFVIWFLAVISDFCWQCTDISSFIAAYIQCYHIWNSPITFSYKRCYAQMVQAIMVHSGTTCSKTKSLKAAFQT